MSIKLLQQWDGIKPTIRVMIPSLLNPFSEILPVFNSELVTWLSVIVVDTTNTAQAERGKRLLMLIRKRVRKAFILICPL